MRNPLLPRVLAETPHGVFEDLSDNLEAISEFINDNSDQAAAWYSIVADKPVVVPSAQIQAQTNLVNAQPIVAGISTPIGSYIGTSGSLLVLLAAGAAVALILWKA